MTAPLRRLLLSESEYAVCYPLSLMAVGNAFAENRIKHQAEVLGDAFEDPGPTMAPGADPSVTHKNIELITALVKRTLPPIRDRYKKIGEATAAERLIYLRVVYYFLHDTFDLKFQKKLIDKGKLAAPFYAEFLTLYDEYLGFLTPAPDIPDAKRLFEVLFQIRRAFSFLYVKVRGRSRSIGRLRAALWNAIFGGPLDEYGLHLWNRMHRFPVLIVGPTGTGKELAAEAIGRSGFVPFNDTPGVMAFAPYDQYYAGINLLGFAPGLLASELYGHCKGAFTGAEKDKTGIFGLVPEYGALLLDEILEISAMMQAELLRVLQERNFRRVGEVDQVQLVKARILAATHRDPAEHMALGLLREDFFRRICIMKVTTPSLRERFDDNPDELRDLVAFIAADLFGATWPSANLVDQVAAVVKAKHAHHPWTGNMRELAQCVVEVKLTGDYLPEKMMDPTFALDEVLRQLRISLDALDRRYLELTLERTGSDVKTAQFFGMDVRTLRRLLNGEGRVRGGPAGKRGAPASKRGAPVSKRGAPVSKRGAPVSKRGAPASKRSGR